MVEFTKNHGISTVDVKKAHGNTTVPDQKTIIFHQKKKSTVCTFPQNRYKHGSNSGTFEFQRATG